MNGSRAMAREICRDLVAALASVDNLEIILCPPATLLATVSSETSGTTIKIAAQDIDHHAAGAHTGQISAEMALEAGASHTIVGHSERRTDQGESDQLIAKKVDSAIAHGLTPIICVGETRSQREAGQTEEVVDTQIQAVIADNGIEAIARSIIAYEPVWAIGTGLTATPEQAQTVHLFIRNQLAKLDSEVAAQCRILYGGSMKPENAAQLMAQPDIDGGLIGGASLKSQDFLAICKAAANAVA